MVILCVDDEPSILAMQKLILQKYGYEAITASGPSEARAIFSSQHVDAVIVDYLMPEENGCALAGWLKKVSPSLPVILISACLTIPEDALSHVDCFLQKPYSPTKLLETLSQLLQGARSREIA